ncbi:hypothetical protein [Tsukamurella soli]|uniref:Uncharacterized protein n=1 Tax=Tsukamurella soli TaxID=644556 RepID=A0ABP8J5W6_9ACTN
MRFSLITLGVACVGFGVLPGMFVRDVASPLASILLHPNAYARAVFADGGAVPALHLTFTYLQVSDLLTALVEIVLGLLLAAAYLRLKVEPRPLTWLRRLHTGSVNDYAAFAVTGLVTVSVVLLV